MKVIKLLLFGCDTKIAMIKNFVFYIRDICDSEYLIPAVAIYVAHFDWPFVCLMLS